MPAYSARPCAGESDLSAALELFQLTADGNHIGPYPYPDLFRQIFTGPDAARDARIWVDESGVPVGYAMMHMPYNNLLFAVHPSAHQNGIEAAMIAWGEEYMRAYNRENNVLDTLDSVSNAEDTERLALLEAHGFQYVVNDTYRMIRPLDEPIPEPRFPEGFRLSHVAGEHETEKFVMLNRKAFDSEGLTVERRLEFMRSSKYCAETDLIALAPDGTWAAFCVCWFDPDQRMPDGGLIGWTDPIGTHPDYRQLGLARALILSGLHALKARGAKVAILGTGEDRPIAVHTYQSLGYRIAIRRRWFSKIL